MKTSKFTQSELSELFNKGEIILFSFKSMFQIRHSANTGFYVQKLANKLSENWTKKGRFIAYTVAQADIIIAKHYAAA